MTAQVSVAQAKAGFAALIARAEAGEEVIVTGDGRPIARVVPMAPSGPVQYGDLRGIFLADDLALPDAVLKSFEPADPAEPPP